METYLQVARAKLHAASFCIEKYTSSIKVPLGLVFPDSDPGFKVAVECYADLLEAKAAERMKHDILKEREASKKEKLRKAALEPSPEEVLEAKSREIVGKIGGGKLGGPKNGKPLAGWQGRNQKGQGKKKGQAGDDQQEDDQQGQRQRQGKSSQSVQGQRQIQGQGEHRIRWLRGASLAKKAARARGRHGEGVRNTSR